MAEVLKDIYNEAFVLRLSHEFKKIQPKFEKDKFQRQLLNELPRLELKDRVRAISRSIHVGLQGDYNTQVNALCRVAPEFIGLEGIIFPQFIEDFGQNDYQTSIPALEFLTRFSTAEFAIRPFIIKYPEQTMAQLLEWSTHPNYHVRRLASEGCRPLLPWAPKLNDLIIDPSPILPILHNLKSDTEDYVYRSVANNLNDISKHHPELVIEICTKWINLGETERWISKHALRTLLKKGNQDAMALFGYGNYTSLSIEKFTIQDSIISIGDSSQITFSFKNKEAKASFRLEYEVNYVKKNGSLSKKVFQIGEKEIDKNERLEITKKIDFKDLSTRKHYPGEHKIQLIVNGIRLDSITINLE